MMYVHVWRTKTTNGGSVMGMVETTEKAPTYLKVSEAAHLLRLHPITLYKLIESRKVPSIKVGGSIRICLDDIRRMGND